MVIPVERGVPRTYPILTGGEAEPAGAVREVSTYTGHRRRAEKTPKRWPWAVTKATAQPAAASAAGSSLAVRMCRCHGSLHNEYDLERCGAVLAPGYLFGSCSRYLRICLSVLSGHNNGSIQSRRIPAGSAPARAYRLLSASDVSDLVIPPVDGVSIT
jgi:hypothetical protein